MFCPTVPWKRLARVPRGGKRRFEIALQEREDNIDALDRRDGGFGVGLGAIDDAQAGEECGHDDGNDRQGDEQFQERETVSGESLHCSAPPAPS